MSDTIFASISLTATWINSNDVRSNKYQVDSISKDITTIPDKYPSGERLY